MGNKINEAPKQEPPVPNRIYRVVTETKVNQVVAQLCQCSHNKCLSTFLCDINLELDKMKMTHADEEGGEIGRVTLKTHRGYQGDRTGGWPECKLILTEDTAF